MKLLVSFVILYYRHSDPSLLLGLLVVGAILFAVVYVIRAVIVVVSWIRDQVRKVKEYIRSIFTTQKVEPIIPSIVNITTASNNPNPTLANNPPIKVSFADIFGPTVSEQLDKWVDDQLVDMDKSITAKDYTLAYAVKDINYSHLLSTVEWKLARLKVLVRDSYKCRDCGKRSTHNHVHHTYYLKDKLPWEIDMEALVSLCQECHSNRHKRDDIGVYEIRRGQRVRASYTNLYCYRCNGSGYLPQFKHVDHGICFACMGSCINQTIFSVALQRLKDLGTSSSDSTRDQCRQYLSSMTPEMYEQKIMLKQEVAKDSMYVAKSSFTPSNIDDDLPF